MGLERCRHIWEGFSREVELSGKIYPELRGTLPELGPGQDKEKEKARGTRISPSFPCSLAGHGVNGFCATYSCHHVLSCPPLPCFAGHDGPSSLKPKSIGSYRCSCQTEFSHCDTEVINRVSVHPLYPKIWANICSFKLQLHRDGSRAGNYNRHSRVKRGVWEMLLQLPSMQLWGPHSLLCASDTVLCIQSWLLRLTHPLDFWDYAPTQMSQQSNNCASLQDSFRSQRTNSTTFCDYTLVTAHIKNQQHRLYLHRKRMSKGL